jgi:Zn-dependent alcohol dehydrogenase
LPAFGPGQTYSPPVVDRDRGQRAAVGFAGEDPPGGLRLPADDDQLDVVGGEHLDQLVWLGRESQIIDRTRGQMADLAVVTVGVLEPEITEAAVSVIGKAGRVVLTSVSRADVKSISLTGSPMVGWHKRIQGSLAGGSNPIYEMPNLLNLYRSGHLKLDEIITQRYSLEQVNEGYHDLLAGKDIRGVILHES